MDYIKELEKRLIEVITDLENTKRLNYNFEDSKGNKIVYMDIDHIDYLIKILKGEE
jgi:hypothetical protein